MHSAISAREAAASSERGRWSALLRRAHAAALGGGEPPSVVRDVVARSWRRSADAGVDPDAAAPRVLDPGEVARALKQRPLGAAIRRVETLVLESLAPDPQLVAFADEGGTLLWVNGHQRAMRTAIAPGFVPGSSCLETSIGTNAIGTALALDEPLQISAAEHFSRQLHGWDCAAAPIHDPTTGRLMGAVNVSGGWRTSTRQNLVVARLLSRAVESSLELATLRDEESLRQEYVSEIGRPVPEGSALVNNAGRIVLAGTPAWLGRHVRLDGSGSPVSAPGGLALSSRRLGRGHLVSTSPGLPLDAPARIVIEALGDRRIVATVDGGRHSLAPRSSELLVLLALNPTGISAGDLATMLYTHAVQPVTLRAELSRLRRIIGPIIRTSPFRLDADAIDPIALASVLRGSAAPGLRVRP